MSRTARYKLGYLLALVVLAAISVFVFWKFHFHPIAMFATAAILLIPGRISGMLYRDFYRGSRLMATGGPREEAVRHFERFLRTVRKQPWRKLCIWLAWPVYSNDIEAMTLNNLGTIHLNAGQVQEAEALFREALELDPSFPIPHFNLAVLYDYREQKADAEAELATAQRLGYSCGTSDRFAQAAGQLLARVEGLGVSRS